MTTSILSYLSYCKYHCVARACQLVAVELASHIYHFSTASYAVMHTTRCIKNDLFII